MNTTSLVSGPPSAPFSTFTAFSLFLPCSEISCGLLIMLTLLGGRDCIDCRPRRHTVVADPPPTGDKCDDGQRTAADPPPAWRRRKVSARLVCLGIRFRRQ